MGRLSVRFESLWAQACNGWFASDKTKAAPAGCNRFSNFTMDYLGRALDFVREVRPLTLTLTLTLEVCVCVCVCMWR